jgi:Asp-tRNA(Asn)/Glu-tRNA(Gln) amidotransferase A subunit family amidase
MAEESAEVSKEQFVEGLELEGRIYQPLGELLERHDALVCPTFAVPALPAEWAEDRPLQIGDGVVEDSFDAMMTIPFNIASRCPVLSVPSGRSRDGVPTGLSIVGRTYDDVTAFRIGQALERARPWLDVPASVALTRGAAQTGTGSAGATGRVLSRRAARPGWRGSCAESKASRAAAGRRRGR